MFSQFKTFLYLCTILFVFIFDLTGCDCDTYRIGRRQEGDMLVMKKVLLSVPTKYPTNHTVIYEYMATNPISLIEYQIGSMCKSESIDALIVLTGEYSLEAIFHISNVTKIIVTMIVFGFDHLSVPENYQPILVSRYSIDTDENYSKMGIGHRMINDRIIFFQAKSTQPSNVPTNHTLEFNITVDQSITYVSFSVDSKKASAKFITATEHSFHGIVYDFNKIGLTAKMYVYGFNQNGTPSEYRPIFQLNTMSNTSTVKMDFFNITTLSFETTTKNSSVADTSNGVSGKSINQFIFQFISISRMIILLFHFLFSKLKGGKDF